MQYMHFVTPGYKIALANRELRQRDYDKRTKSHRDYGSRIDQRMGRPIKSQIFLVTLLSSREIEQIARLDPAAIPLQQVRGIGPLTATALLATAGDASQFACGREMAASFGLTSKQNSSGGKERLLGIGKRGDAYLRSLLVHGARAVIRTAQAKTDRLSIWIIRIATTRHPKYRRSGVSE